MSELSPLSEVERKSNFRIGEGDLMIGRGKGLLYRATPADGTSALGFHTAVGAVTGSQPTGGSISLPDEDLTRVTPPT
jgi:hypothetical protein